MYKARNDYNNNNNNNNNDIIAILMIVIILILLIMEIGLSGVRRPHSWSPICIKISNN